jgi:hypothetical protein
VHLKGSNSSPGGENGEGQGLKAGSGRRGDLRIFIRSLMSETM